MPCKDKKGVCTMFRRIKINLLQKPVTTIVLFITLTLILAFVFFCVSMLSSYGVLYREMKEMYDGEISIGINSNSTMSHEEQMQMLEEGYNPLENAGEITYENIYDILEVEGVIGVNWYISGNFMPINFENVQSYTGPDPYENSREEAERYGELTEEEIIEQGKLVSILGEIDVRMSGDFRRGFNELIEGSFPQRGKAQVIICDVLANQNELSIGDFLTLQDKDTENGGIYEFEVVGIYSTKLKFEVVENEYGGRGSDMFRASPYNRIYADWEMLNSITEKYSGLINLRVYHDPFIDPNVIIQGISQTSLNPNEFKAQVFIAEYEMIGKGLDNFYNSMSALTLAVGLGGIAIFVIILLMYNNNKEIGMLICIGEKRKNIVRQKACEYVAIAAVALPFAILLGYFAVVALSTPLNPQEAVSENSVTVSMIETGEKALRPKLTASFNTIDALLTAAYALVLVLAAYIINKLKVKKHNTKKFIMGEEE